MSRSAWLGLQHPQTFSVPFPTHPQRQVPAEGHKVSEPTCLPWVLHVQARADSTPLFSLGQSPEMHKGVLRLLPVLGFDQLCHLLTASCGDMCREPAEPLGVMEVPGGPWGCVGVCGGPVPHSPCLVSDGRALPSQGSAPADEGPSSSPGHACCRLRPSDTAKVRRAHCSEDRLRGCQSNANVCILSPETPI